MKITVALRSRSSEKFPLNLELPESATVDDLKQAIHKKIPVYTSNRQGLTFDKRSLKRGTLLNEYGIKDGDTVFFKDWGMQIGWKTVFITEYLGPLLIHPIFYYFPEEIYGKSFEHSRMQTVAYYLVLVHFLKREFETLFIHRFSHDTMPFRYVFRNSAHYYLLAGLNLAYWVYGPWNAAEVHRGHREDWFIWTCVGIWTWAQLSNLTTHIILRNLRPPGTRVRKIPYGYGFNLVTCPHYLFEIIGWTVIAFLTKSAAALLFTVVCSIIMYDWAVKRHKSYLQDFKDYPKNRKILFPFLV